MSSSYLDAPQTAMLATHCCVCGRALCDAQSVELGIGPECGAALHAMEGLGEDQRRMANRLTWAASQYAAQGRIVEVRRCADALEGIGLAGIAGMLRERFKNAERLAKIMVTRVGEDLHFKTPFCRGSKDEFLRALRALPTRRYAGNGINVVAAKHKAQLWQFLMTFYPGAYGEGDEGTFRVPGESKEVQS